MKKKEYIKGANPYMPLWEHIPDGEPRVFTNNGEERLYVYGSHDMLKTEYCGTDYVVWSAPTDDLTDWKCHGVCYRSSDGSPLYAPDVVEKDGIYYLYAAEGRGSRIFVAKSETPWGPFTDPVKTELGFDPGVLVDDDGRVYAFWGFCAAYAAELCDDMATIKTGTFRVQPIGCCNVPWRNGNLPYDPVDSFFEASSPRKVGNKYVYIYSKRYEGYLPEYGIIGPCSGFLSYQYSSSPLDGYVWGGDISLNAGEILTTDEGREHTFRWGNNHGSIVCVKGKWYVFYHRQTGRDEYSRQAMLEPIEVAFGKDGNPYIGKVIYENGEPIASVPVEMTSQGAHTDGIDAYKIISAGYTCHISRAKGAYIVAVYDEIESVTAPVADIPSGGVVGFRYLNFGDVSPKTVTVEAESECELTVNVRINSRDGEIIATVVIEKGKTEADADVKANVTGKKAVYFEFVTEDNDMRARFDRFTFDR